MQQLIELLDKGGYSCVIASVIEGDRWSNIRHFSMRGIADLHRLKCEEPESLRGAYIADKVVGKGAAAIMASCGVKRLFAHVISDGAYELLLNAGVEVEFGVRTTHIINREGNGWCPVELRCRDVEQLDEILLIVDRFILELKTAQIK